MMDNEMEQKKEYVAPQMEIVQFQSQGSILQESESPCGKPSCGISVEP